jgi:biotin carboxyl carrier protein
LSQATDEPTPRDASVEAVPNAPVSRSAASRADDHAAIGRLAEDLLPSLVARLAATGLGELEIREGTWKLRVRRPGGIAGTSRRAADRTTRAQPGHEGHGHAPAAFEGHRSARAGQAAHGANRSNPASLNGGGGHDDGRGPDPHRAVATSPAVGVFRIRPEARAGTRVRAGDRVASVDMLGVPQDVLAPADGIVTQTLVDPGDGVEYGQELVVIELMTPTGRGAADGGGGPA